MTKYNKLDSGGQTTKQTDELNS